MVASGHTELCWPVSWSFLLVICLTGQVKSHLYPGWRFIWMTPWLSEDKHWANRFSIMTNGFSVGIETLFVLLSGISHPPYPLTSGPSERLSSVVSGWRPGTGWPCCSLFESDCKKDTESQSVHIFIQNLCHSFCSLTTQRPTLLGAVLHSHLWWRGGWNEHTQTHSNDSV